MQQWDKLQFFKGGEFYASRIEGTHEGRYNVSIKCFPLGGKQPGGQCKWYYERKTKTGERREVPVQCCIISADSSDGHNDFPSTADVFSGPTFAACLQRFRRNPLDDPRYAANCRAIERTIADLVITMSSLGARMLFRVLRRRVLRRKIRRRIRARVALRHSAPFGNLPSSFIRFLGEEWLL